MIGGGSLLSGLIERIEEKTRLSVSLAQINSLNHRNVSNSALFSTAISLAQKGFESSKENPDNKNGRASWGEKLANKIKELYIEYF